MNKGYVGYSMSINADNAYKFGEKPLSKWTKKAPHGTAQVFNKILKKLK